MRRPVIYVFALLTLLLASCEDRSGIVTFWDEIDVTVREGQVQEAEDRFAGFAELALDAPVEDATEALGRLFKRLKDDEVSYYIYAGWMEYAFHNLYSPCRNLDLFSYAVERIAEDEILSKEEISRLQRLVEYDNLNLQDYPCRVPEEAETDGAAFYLVVDLDCRSCLSALKALATEYPQTEHIALCFGYGRFPDVPGWRFTRPAGMNDFFELEAAPFWFLKGDDGLIEIPYNVDFNKPVYASPEEL